MKFNLKPKEIFRERLAKWLLKFIYKNSLGKIKVWKQRIIKKELLIPSIKKYYKVTITKTIWYILLK